MNIRRILFYWGLAIALLATGSTVFLSESTIQDGFEEIEKRHAISHTIVAENLLQNFLDKLSRFVLDWSVWDDAYAYVQDKNNTFEQENLIKKTYIDQDLTAIIFINQQGRIIYSHAVDSTGEASPRLLAMLTKKVMPLVSPVASTCPFKGFIRSGEHLYMIAGHPILTSKGEGPSPGFLLVIQKISSKIISSISASVGCAVMIGSHVVQGHSVKKKAHDTKVQIKQVNDSIIQAVLSFNTLDAKDQGLLTVNVARDVTLYGSKIVMHNNMLIVLLMVFILSTLYYIINRTILNRLESLTNQVAKVDIASNDAPLLRVKGKDEISLLGNIINELLMRLHTAREEQQKQQIVITENERFLNQILNSISTGILLIDPTSREIVEINDFVLNLSHRHREEVVGKVCHKLTCPAERNQCPILDLHQPYDLSQRVLLDRDGRRIPILKSVSIVTHQGRDFLLETIVDITETEQARSELERIKKHLEDLVVERTEKLEKANFDLKNLNKSKDLFLSSASHELRTPLTSILGFLKLIERGFNKHFYGCLSQDTNTAKQADRFLENIAIVRTEAERLGRLVNDLLDLDKINSGKMEWRDEHLKVNEILAIASDLYSGYSVERPDVLLKVEPLQEEAIIWSDRDKIHQVLVNLMNNAFKFTEKGQITLSAVSEGDAVKFSVSDTGKGITEKDQKHIFDLFYQTEDVNKRSSKHFGTGLGLAICQQVIAHYGSEILVESTPGKGSTFSFVLPKKQ